MALSVKRMLWLVMRFEQFTGDLTWGDPQLSKDTPDDLPMAPRARYVQATYRL